MRVLSPFPAIEPLDVRTLLSAGELDPTLGGTGKILTDADPLTLPSAVVVQDDGRFVTAATAAALDGVPPDIVLTRYELGGAALQSRSINFAGDGSDSVSDMLLTPDARFVIAGVNVGAERDPASYIAKVRSNFDMDGGFGLDGLVQVPGPVGELKLMQQADGKLVATDGRTIFRFTETGALDTSFGGDGMTTLINDGRSASDPSVFVGTDSKIYVVASVFGFRNELLIARVNPATGALDNSFSGDGRAFVSGSSPLAAPVAGGKIMLVTPAGLGDALLVRRLRNDGAVDTTFGNAGSNRVPIDGMPIDPQTLLASPGGQSFVVVGQTTRSATLGDAFVARFATANGSPDESFGPDGVRLLDLYNNDIPRDAAIAPDGKIVLTGFGFAENQAGFDYRQFAARLIGTDIAPGARITSTGTLLVEGSELSEQIELFNGSGDRVIVKINGVTQSFPQRRVKRISVSSAAGNDTISLAATTGNSFSVTGGAGNDSIIGNGRPNALDGGAGDDTLSGLGGDDTLTGDVGKDLIFRGSGNDMLNPGLGDDRVFGDAGNDTIQGGDGRDLLDGGSGFDTAFYRAGDTLNFIDDAVLLES